MGKKAILLLLSAVVLLASCANPQQRDNSLQCEKQTIDLPGVHNARQLGGYVIGDKKIRMDLLLRSGTLAKASDEAISALHDKYKLALVADFRSSMERSKAPDRDVEDAINVWLPVLEKKISGEKVDTVMAALHFNMDNPSYTVELLRQQNIQDALSTSYDAIVFDEDCRQSFADFLDSLVALPEGRAAQRSKRGFFRKDS